MALTATLLLLSYQGTWHAPELPLEANCQGAKLWRLWHAARAELSWAGRREEELNNNGRAAFIT